MRDRPSLLRLLTRYGQGHLLRWLDTLEPPRQERLLGQIASVDLEWLQRILATPPRTFDPLGVKPFSGVIQPDDPDAPRARALGEDALRRGTVAALVVAGGQGTRLGLEGPKGAVAVGPVSGINLFQLHAQRLVALGRRHGTTPPLYLMTSEANHQATIEILAAHDDLGLPRDRVFVFRQGLAPAVDEQGKLLLDAPDHLVMTPNGNGGLFRAMKESGALDQMRRQGIETISYTQVDNPLAPSCDPLFVGYHLLRQSDYSCKAIPKVAPDERVGVFALVEGRLRVVEYNELPAQLAAQTDDDGRLAFGYSNPGIFCWSTTFARAQAERSDLPFHKAHKTIPHLNERGELVAPERPNGYKLECFAMDTLPDARRHLVLWCDRNEEFAPIKNASGVDSLASAQRLMTQRWIRWLRRAGARIATPPPAVEISPLYALDAEELAAKLSPGFEVTRDLYLDE